MPGPPNMSPGGARRSPGGARRIQEEPGGSRRIQEDPGRARKSQEEPRRARRSQEEPGGSRSLGWESLVLCTASVCWVPFAGNRRSLIRGAGWVRLGRPYKYPAYPEGVKERQSDDDSEKKKVKACIPFKWKQEAGLNSVEKEPRVGTPVGALHQSPGFSGFP